MGTVYSDVDGGSSSQYMYTTTREYIYVPIREKCECDCKNLVLAACILVTVPLALVCYDLYINRNEPPDENHL
jgi:hypothetical protein